MTKILGLDLGTASIGWTIRNTEAERENQIIDFGVIVFKKGVGEGKSGEYSLAAERRKNRSKRRLYNAKRYRKWELLKVLIEKKMCPLKEDELRLWSIGEWVIENGKKRNKGRKFPYHNEAWQKWLAMDPDFFGNKGKSKNGKLIRKSPYDLRCELIESFEEDEKTRNYKIGRALYHMAQRRGFQSSRKGGESAYGRDKDYEKWKANNENASVAKFYIEKLEQGERIRGRKPMQRKYFIEDDFFKICNTQSLDKELVDKLYRAIYFVRPLRSQKGLVGKCTLEKGKPRIPISHPAFEEFRALAFINTIKWRKTNSKEPFTPIPIDLKKKIFENLFFKRKRSGEVETRGYFKFEEIVKNFSENYTYEFNYAKYDRSKPKDNGGYELRRNPSVSTCPVIAGMMNVFDNGWKNKFIADENRFGINWSGLSLKYEVKYGSKAGEQKVLNYEAIWHLLFDYLQIKDDTTALKKFCKEVLEWDANKTEQFVSINIQQGYGQLSRNAIIKILPFLQEGHVYSEAVFYANLPKVLGEEIFNKNKGEITAAISETINENKKVKEKLNIVNELIKKYFSENKPPYRPKGVSEEIKNVAINEVTKSLEWHIGKTNWENKPEGEKRDYFEFVLNKYLAFLDGKQPDKEKASSIRGKNPGMDYYLLPRLDNAIKKTLKDEFEAKDDRLKYLYHHADIDIYPKTNKKFIVFQDGHGKTEDVKLTKEEWQQVKEWYKENPDAHVYTGSVSKVYGKGLSTIPQLDSPVPPTRSLKNPMMMRTMYELKKLVNYLLVAGKIDEETRIVIEIARELNDSNMRKAIERWQRDRENENKEYAEAMKEMFNWQNPSDDDYNKFRAAVEQIPEDELNKIVGEFGEKYNDFIQSYFMEKKDESEDSDTDNDSYLAYLAISREEFARLLNSRIPNSQKFMHQIISTAKNFNKRRKELKDLLLKYRLWKEQKFKCIYTGRQISFQELIDGNKCQIEHTIPRSLSFDSATANLTVCDAVYNNVVKDNAFPTECPNYDNAAECQTVEGPIECSSIKDRVESMIKPKVDELTKRLEQLKVAAKKIKDWEVDKRNANIQLRYYLQFELEYWRKKYQTFTVKPEDWQDKWKNSQLVDTQIITKYATAYMKSLFHRVDVQKSSITKEFKKILGFPEKYWREQKDRSRHSHHAIDALALTLIPGSAKREAILKLWYEKEEIIQSLTNEKNIQKREEKEARIKLVEENLKEELKSILSLDVNNKIQQMENTILINHVSRDRTLTPTRKKIRKRGKIQHTSKGDEMVMQGNSIRGQLHKETYLGAVKVLERNEQGYPIKENGRFKTKEDELWIVARKAIKDLKPSDFNKPKEEDKTFIVDELLRQHIKQQLDEGKSLGEVKDFQGNTIRHIRCRYKSGQGHLKPRKAIEIREHTYPPKQEHKKYVRAQNEENYLYLFYEKEKPQQIEREAQIVSLFDASDKDFPGIKELWYDKGWNQLKGMPLKHIIRVGDKVIFYTEEMEEVKELSPEDLQRRIFVVYKFNEPSSLYIYLQNHLEARPEKELDKLKKGKNGYSEFDPDFEFDPDSYQYRLYLTAEKLNCLIERKDFIMKPDGKIVWLF